MALQDFKSETQDKKEQSGITVSFSLLHKVVYTANHNIRFSEISLQRLCFCFENYV